MQTESHSIQTPQTCAVVTIYDITVIHGFNRYFIINKDVSRNRILCILTSVSVPLTSPCVLVCFSRTQEWLLSRVYIPTMPPLRRHLCPHRHPNTMFGVTTGIIISLMTIIQTRASNCVNHFYKRNLLFTKIIEITI